MRSSVQGRVRYGHERVSVTYHGRPVAAVVSMEDVRLLEKLEEALDALDAVDAIHEADRDGSLSFAELRERLGRQGSPWTARSRSRAPRLGYTRSTGRGRPPPHRGRLDADATLGRNRRGREMNNEFTAVIKQDGEWWIGWIEEVPGVNCQEATRDELIESLTVTLREALDLNREDALAAAGDLYSEAKIGV